MLAGIDLGDKYLLVKPLGDGTCYTLIEMVDQR